MTLLPTTTAMRSVTAADRRTDAIDAKTQRRGDILKGLSYGNKKLKMPDVLKGRCGGALDQLLVRALQTEERWRIVAVGQIDADWAHRRLVADAEAHGVDHIVEVLNVVLVNAERKAGKVRIDVPHIVKDYAVDVFAEEREAQLRGVEE